VTPHNGSLDVLRALAIAAVLACHIIGSFVPGSTLTRATSLGGHGVDLFFVLSGWLLGRQLYREIGATSAIDLKRFWTRRWLRTLPAYYAMLFAIAVGLILKGKSDLLDWRYIVFLQNYLVEMPFFGVSWSLCVEEHFYLAVAPAILLLWRVRWAWLVVLEAFMLATAAEFYEWYPKPAHAEFEVYASHVRGQQCAVGVLLAWLAVRRPLKWQWLCRNAWLFFAMSILCIVLSILNRTLWDWWLPDWQTLGWGLIFAAWVLLAEATTPLNWAAARFVAARAYSLYLVHTEAIAVAKKVDAGSEMQMAIALAVSFAMAEALYRCVERPFIRLRDRDTIAKRR
jgi:peptidoglycan/LPS O-acetylase OafA/YrhL